MATGIRTASSSRAPVELSSTAGTGEIAGTGVTSGTGGTSGPTEISGPPSGSQPRFPSATGALRVLVTGARTAAIHHVVEALVGPPHRVPHVPRRGLLVLRGPSSGPAQQQHASGWADRRRRVELVVDSPLLQAMTLTAVRAVPAPNGDGHRLVCDLVEECHSLVLVTDGRRPFQPAEIEVLRSAVARAKDVLLAITHADAGSAWPEVVRAANQAYLARGFPGLALQPWHTISRSGPGVRELRDRLMTGATSARQATTVPAERRDPPIRVASSAIASSWPQLVATEVEHARASVIGFVDQQIAGLREAVRRSTDPVADLGQTGSAGTAASAEDGWAAAAGRAAGDAGSPEDASSVEKAGSAAEVVVSGGPAERLGLALQALSVALAAEVRSAVDGALVTILSRVLVDSPDARTLTRVRAVLRRDVAERCSGLPVCYRALRVTATAAAAVATSRDPVPALSAHAGSADGVLPPLGVGFTTNCLPVVRALASGSARGERDWVNRSLAALAPVLRRELECRFADLKGAIEDLVAEGLDHDLLLV